MCFYIDPSWKRFYWNVFRKPEKPSDLSTKQIISNCFKSSWTIILSKMLFRTEYFNFFVKNCPTMYPLNRQIFDFTCTRKKNKRKKKTSKNTKHSDFSWVPTGLMQLESKQNNFCFLKAFSLWPHLHALYYTVSLSPTLCLKGIIKPIRVRPRPFSKHDYNASKHIFACLRLSFSLIQFNELSLFFMKRTRRK